MEANLITLTENVLNNRFISFFIFMCVDVHVLLRVALSDKNGTAHLRLAFAVSRYARFVNDNCGAVDQLMTRFTYCDVSEKIICHKLPNGYFHRSVRDENGFTLPALICADGSKWWFKRRQASSRRYG